MVRIYRRYARAKVRLIPLVDRWSQRAARTGAIGPVRPLVLDDASPAARSIDDQWLLGEDILVAPVLAEGARSREVYLPAGASWQRVKVGEQGEFVAQGEPMAGGRTITAAAPLEDIPIFTRAQADEDGGAQDQGDASEAPAPAASEPTAPAGDPDAGGTTPVAGEREPVGLGRGGDGTRDSGRLPFTGLEVVAAVLAGLGLLGAGVVLRRRAGAPAFGRNTHR